jgi:hypothetical protein
MKGQFQLPRGAALSGVMESTNPAEHNQENKYAHKSNHNRQGDGVLRHEEGLQNLASARLSGSNPPAAAKLVRLRDDTRGVREIRSHAGGQDGGIEHPEHQPGVFGSHPHVRSDHESLTLFRVCFSDYSAMLIDARHNEHAAELGQAWSRHWDRLDPRRVTTITKL